MAAINVAPIVLTDVLLTLGTDDYQKHVSSVEFTPSATQATWKGLGANTFTATGTATWTCTISYAQDWETTDSLSLYLLENEGETVSATFEPVSGGSGFTATVVLTPGSIGGAVDSVAVATVTLGVVGKPTYVAAE